MLRRRRVGEAFLLLMSLSVLRHRSGQSLGAITIVSFWAYDGVEGSLISSSASPVIPQLYISHSPELTFSKCNPRCITEAKQYFKQPLLFLIPSLHPRHT